MAHNETAIKKISYPLYYYTFFLPFLYTHDTIHTSLCSHSPFTLFNDDAFHTRQIRLPQESHQ